jgi:acylphosphatase
LKKKNSHRRAIKTLLSPPNFGFIPAVPGPTTTTNRSRIEIYYSGHVQGVGFRYTAKSVATGFEVCGIVRNLSDGRVQLVAEGTRDELEAFRAALRDAGLDHFIRDEKITWATAQNEFLGFEIVH